MKYAIVLTSAEDNHQTVHCEVEGDFLPRGGEPLRVNAMVFVKKVDVHHEVDFSYDTKRVESRAVVCGEIPAKEFDYLANDDENWRFHDDSHLED